MKHCNALTTSVAAGILASLSLVPASAATTFASFLYDGPGRVQGNGAGVISATNLQVVFSFSSGGTQGVPSIGFGSYSALLSFTANRTNDASLNTIPFTFVSQGYTISSFSLTSPIPLTDGKGGFASNLLSGTASTASFFAQVPGSTGSLNASKPAGSAITYTSSFVTFPFPQTDADLGFSLTDILPNPVGINGTLGSTNINTFSSAISGTFGYNPSPASNVPEPGALALLAGMSIPASLFAMKLRKKRK